MTTLVLLLTGCSAHRFFYFPNRYLYDDPVKHGIKYEMMEIDSLNGKKLSAILFQSPTPPKGTVVHFHGNFGNVSNHFWESQYLTGFGFDVIAFDYQGYGGSEGSPGPKKTVEDGIAVVRYAQANLRPSAQGVVVLGQSIGAAVATVVVAKESLVKAVVLESGFSSYRTQARATLKRSAWTWLLYPIYPFFLGTTYDPIKYIDKISPRPVFFIHGDKDTIVPVEMSRKLFERAKEPKKLWIVPNVDHLQCRRKNKIEYENSVADFFTQALQK